MDDRRAGERLRIRWNHRHHQRADRLQAGARRRVGDSVRVGRLYTGHWVRGLGFVHLQCEEPPGCSVECRDRHGKRDRLGRPLGQPRRRRRWRWCCNTARPIGARRPDVVTRASSEHSRSVNRLERVLDDGPTSPSEMNELHRTAKRGNKAGRRELLASEAERSRFNEFDARGRTPLMRAVRTTGRKG
jgi:hypothetical protein